jgi:hypothetical protein
MVVGERMARCVSGCGGHRPTVSRAADDQHPTEPETGTKPEPSRQSSHGLREHASACVARASGRDFGLVEHRDQRCLAPGRTALGKERHDPFLRGEPCERIAIPGAIRPPDMARARRSMRVRTAGSAVAGVRVTVFAALRARALRPRRRSATSRLRWGARSTRCAEHQTLAAGRGRRWRSMCHRCSASPSG